MALNVVVRPAFIAVVVGSGNVTYRVVHCESGLRHDFKQQASCRIPLVHHVAARHMDEGNTLFELSLQEEPWF